MSLIVPGAGYCASEEIEFEWVEQLLLYVCEQTNHSNTQSQRMQIQ